MKAALLFCARLWIHICLVLPFTMLGCFIVAEAQATRTQSNAARRLDEFNRQSEKAARDELGREMIGRKPSVEERRQAEVRKAQIKEDFEGLQAAYNEILTKFHAQERLSETYVSDITAKIAKNGARLRHNIVFPEQKADRSEKSEASLPPGSVRNLCLLIHTFLTNPIFETGVLDVIEAEKARDTLDKIIHISQSLHHNLVKTH